MPDLLTAANEFVGEVLTAVATALENGDTTSLDGDLESAVVDFADEMGIDQTDLEEPATKADEESNLFAIVKTDVEERMIWGWGSVITVKGVPVVDRQNDIIELSELKQAVYHFMDNSRTGGEMHKLMDIGVVVESMVFSDELQKAMGINLGKEGWFVGVRVDNDTTWERVKKGELRSFSLGGSAERVPA